MSNTDPESTEPVKWVEALSFPSKPPRKHVRPFPEPQRKIAGTATFLGQATEGSNLKVMCLMPVVPATTPAGTGGTPPPTPSAGPAIDATGIAAKGFVPPPPQVLRGALYKGSILEIGGPSKSHKSFSLIDLCVSVATGNEFWEIETTAGPVIYINLELQDFELSSRLIEILSARGFSLSPKQLGIWNLRGQTMPIEAIVDTLIKHYSSNNLSMIVIDPIYKCYGDRDENSAAQMTSLFGQLERLAYETGAAVAFSAHFAKGNSSAKAAIDRISGSGVFARYPDAIFVVNELTKGPMQQYSVETVLRNFPEIDPFALEWRYPLMRVIPPPPSMPGSPSTGRPTKYNIEDWVAIVGAKRFKTKDWQRNSGMPESTFKGYKRKLIDDKRVAKTKDGEWYAVGEKTDPDVNPNFDPLATAVVIPDVDIF